MFTKPIFETLPIALIALGILLVALVHHPVATITGALIILGNCFIIYRYYTKLGTNSDVLLEKHRTT